MEEPLTLSVSNLGIDGLEDVEQIGTGGSSRVYRARQGELDRIVAVKVLNLGHDQSVSKRFDRERKAMGRLSLHEGIVPIYSSGLTTHGEPYLVMPYYANGSLQNQIDAGPMEWQTAVSYIDVAAETIAAAHDEGVVHLDLKPANILLTNHGAPRIADFGIAKLMGQGASAGTTGGAAFTPAYSAPETFLDGVTGPPSDVYGLGATLWALLVGHPPFLTPGEDTNLMAVIGRVVNNPVGDLRQFTPAAICAVIERAMAKEPEDRYQTAREFSLALKNGAAGASPDFQPVPDGTTRGTILFPDPAPPVIAAAAGMAARPETRSVSRVDQVELPPSIASTAAMPAADPPRPLLQETAQPLPRPAGGPPSIAPTPLFDLDRFRFGPILLGLVAFLGVIGVALWALNRGSDTRATDSEPSVTVTDPASPSLDPNSGDQPVTGNTATGGLGGSIATRGTSAATSPSTTPASSATTSTTAASSTSTTDRPTTASTVATTASSTTTSTTRPSTTSTTASTTSTSTASSTSTTASTTSTTASTTSSSSSSTTEATTTTSSTSSSTTGSTAEVAAATGAASTKPSVNITSTAATSNSVTVAFTADQCVSRYRVSAIGPTDSPVVVSDVIGGPCRKTFNVGVSGLTGATRYNITVIVYNANSLSGRTSTTKSTS